MCTPAGAHAGGSEGDVGAPKATYYVEDEKVLRLEGEEEAERTPSAALLNGDLLDEQFDTFCALAAEVVGDKRVWQGRGGSSLPGRARR